MPVEPCRNPAGHSTPYFSLAAADEKAHPRPAGSGAEITHLRAGINGERHTSGLELGQKGPSCRAGSSLLPSCFCRTASCCFARREKAASPLNIIAQMSEAQIARAALSGDDTGATNDYGHEQKQQSARLPKFGQSA